MKKCPLCGAETAELHVVVDADGAPIPMCPACARKIAVQQANRTGKRVDVYRVEPPKRWWQFWKK